MGMDAGAGTQLYGSCACANTHKHTRTNTHTNYATAELHCHTASLVVELGARYGVHGAGRQAAPQHQQLAVRGAAGAGGAAGDAAERRARRRAGGQPEAPQRRRQGWRRLQAVLLLHHRLLLRRGTVSAADPRDGCGERGRRWRHSSSGGSAADVPDRGSGARLSRRWLRRHSRQMRSGGGGG